MHRRAAAASKTVSNGHGSSEHNGGPSSRKRRGRRNNQRVAPATPSWVLPVGLLCFLGGVILMVVSLKKGGGLSDTSRFKKMMGAAPPLQVTQDTRCYKSHLTRRKLDKSLALGTKFLMNHQQPAGNFDYEYNWMEDTMSRDDAEVRQAGALWGLTLIFHDGGGTDDRVAAKLQKGFDFFRTNSKTLEKDGVIMRYITYPGGSSHDSGTVGLVALSLIDYLRVRPDDADLRLFLHELMPFLVTQHSTLHSDRFQAWQELRQYLPQVQKTEGFFRSTFDKHGKRHGGPSSYYDGECLLAMVKAAKYIQGYDYLLPMAVETAKSLHQRHVVDALANDDDSDDTKGFYQWSSMAFFELATTPGIDEATSVLMGSWLIELALWMIDVHQTLEKRANTGYAYEGIVHAWAWASHTASSSEDKETAQHLHCTIEKGLSKLMSWQVGMGKVEKADPNWDGEKGLGGVQNSKDQPGLRIDVTQHQMHATILARRYIHKKSDMEDN